MSNDILVVDDEESIRWVLGTSLEKAGYKVDLATNGSEALDKAIDDSYSLILLDINMPDISGFDVLKRLRQQDIFTPVILITAQNTVDNAIHGIKEGAYDYIAKPFDLDEVQRIVKKAIDSYKDTLKLKRSKKQSDDEVITLDKIVGKSPDMLRIYKSIGRIADKDITVLITGESGTGKELITKAIHYHSHRKNNKLVSVNISAIPKELIESELFGHEKGAFTGAQNMKIGRFEEATGGTLHLDEIGEMSPDLQSKLLRILEENRLYRLGSETPVEVDVRIIATTNRDIPSEVEMGNFREDLYYRLNAININIPPLRNRKDDLPSLVTHFINKYSKELNIEKKVFSDDVNDLFSKYNWPGNVRELENTIKRLMVLTPDRIINKDHLAVEASNLISRGFDGDGFDKVIREQLSNLLSNTDELDPELYSIIIRKIEKQLFDIILEMTNGNKKRAASMLGINRNTLTKKLNELGLS